MDNYEINRNTLAVIPDDKYSKIYEVDNSFVIHNTTKKIIENSCEYFGSSLEGRQKGTFRLTGITHKVPIIVEETNKLIFFPTSSPKNSNCGWISLKHIDYYYKINNRVCIEFKTGNKLVFDESFNTIDNQILRASRLESVLSGRIS